MGKVSLPEKPWLVDLKVLGYLAGAKAVLEVGCGDGRLVVALACALRRQIVA